VTGRGQLQRRLKAADWLARPEVQRVFALLDGDAKRTRAVGGIVRDTLLGIARPNAEVDFASELRPDEVMARATEAGVTAVPTGVAHGTVTLLIGDVVAEVTTLRQDVETDGRHATVSFGTDWRADAERRDFTINAFYADANGDLFDPLDGFGDLLPPKVRFIGDPDRRIAEDRLRVYRFFRFSASHAGERFDAAGLAAVRRAAGTLDQLSAERVGSELRRMLSLPRIVTTLRAMRDCGILVLAPETIDRLQAYGQQAHQPNFGARLALLAALEKRDFQAAWRLSNEEMTRARNLLAAAALLQEFRIHEAVYRFPDLLADATDVAAVLAGWTQAGRSAVLDQLAQVRPQPFPLRGADLLALGLEPGPRLGHELARLERCWIDSGFALGREDLLGMVERPD
jgi:poly(A) polymerase